VTNYRDEFNDALRAPGSDGLIKTLSDKNRGPGTQVNEQATDTAACGACANGSASFARARAGRSPEALYGWTAPRRVLARVATQSYPRPASSRSGLDAVDSAAVAVLLSWRRRAATEGRHSLADVPTSLVALAELYGVEDYSRRNSPA